LLLAWITDPHLNFLRHPEASKAFGQYVREDLNAYEVAAGDGKYAVVITGDIAECQSLVPLLDDFIRGVGVPVYFVLGNHDFYGGSFEATHLGARAVTKNTQGVWLTEAGVIELTPTIALVGHDGWYDVRLGSGVRSNVNMSDFYVIEDLTGKDMYGERTRLPTQVIALKCQQIADEAAQKAKPLLQQAATKYAQVFFATHVPPFQGATWHQGKNSEPNWVPWFSSKVMGDMLVDVAYEFPLTEFTVLCGHTHGEGEYIPVPNLRVLTGGAVYGHPKVHHIFEVY